MVTRSVTMNGQKRTNERTNEPTN